MIKVAVVLSGCGVFDGAEIHESVLSLYFIEKLGGRYQCFAPDMQQLHVIDHLSGKVAEGESRNVLTESARIARGNIQAITDLDASEFDVLILPGGFGAAKNLCNFSIVGADNQIQPQVLQACKDFAEQGKPAGYACIAPALMTHIYKNGVKLTIGQDKETVQALNQAGAEHQSCEVNQVVVDTENKVVSTPAYMLAKNISDAASSIEAMVSAVFKLAKTN